MNDSFQSNSENLRAGYAAIRQAKQDAKLIDAVPASSDSTTDNTKRIENTIAARYEARRKTQADYLADHPELIPVLKAMGKL
jgi:hypothetical protein